MQVPAVDGRVSALHCLHRSRRIDGISSFARACCDGEVEVDEVHQRLALPEGQPDRRSVRRKCCRIVHICTGDSPHIQVQVLSYCAHLHIRALMMIITPER